MADKRITVVIPEQLAKNAEEFGLLTPEHLIALLEADVEEKVTAFAVEAVNEVRAEKREAQRDEVIEKARQMLAKLDALEPKLTQAEIDEEIRAAQDDL